MSKLFGNLTTAGAEKVTDRVGGGGTVPTGIYAGAKIKAAYAGKSAGGAQSVTVMVEVGGIEHRETLWVTNKNGDNTYPDKQDKTKKHLLPGFIVANDLCLLVTNAELSDQDFEEKVLSLYDFDAKKEVPTNVHVITGLTGKEITLAIVEQIVDKQKKDDNGVYQNTGETRTENTIEKVLHTDRRTVVEIREGFEEPAWATKWAEKNQGKEARNRAKGADGKSGAPGGRSGAPGAAGGASQSPKTSLFGAK